MLYADDKLYKLVFFNSYICEMKPCGLEVKSAIVTG